MNQQISTLNEDLVSFFQEKELVAYRLYRESYRADPNSSKTKQLENVWANLHKTLCDNEIPILIG